MEFRSLVQNRRFSPLKSAVLTHFQNQRFCLIFEIGGFVRFPKTALLFHLKSAILSCPRKLRNNLNSKNMKSNYRKQKLNTLGEENFRLTNYTNASQSRRFESGAKLPIMKIRQHCLFKMDENRRFVMIQMVSFFRLCKDKSFSR